MSAPDLNEFVVRWSASGASERANKDQFLIELCGVLGVEPPNPTKGDPEIDDYVFEKDAPVVREGGRTSVTKIDLYKRGHFILEAKQGSEAGATKLGTAKRKTQGWTVAMNDAYGQGLGYSKTFDEAVPFIVVCDIGYCFDLFADFSGNWQYRPFPNAQRSRIFLKDLPDNPEQLERLRQLFLDPNSLDPSKHSAQVTREVAEHLARLANKLEASGQDQQAVAKFLMRCLFTMFAEDVGLLPDNLFTSYLRDFWIKNPASFPGGIESLWRAMNDGGHLPTAKILKFNGGLFRAPESLPLDKDALELLLRAAKCDWSGVEPAIFGTLLERALDPVERHRLGAHFTPRTYVERIVKPTIEDPLREEWDAIRIQVRVILKDLKEAKTASRAELAARTKKLNKAEKLVLDFHSRLLALRILDPACGTGNFLYVAMDSIKRLESEVLAQLGAIQEGDQDLFSFEGARISPEQFLGIEIKPWAKEIAELVLWIGYLQWHFRQYGQSVPVPEPVLRDYKNIECRDAVLAYDSVELVRDEAGKPVTSWDRTSFITHAVTGNAVPDTSALAPVYTYVRPRKAEWPEADFIVGNPPFIGASRMRELLGNSYVDALRGSTDEVSDSADYVMFWWNECARRTRAGSPTRFGLVTTNSIRQTFNRRVTERHMVADEGVVATSSHPRVISARNSLTPRPDSRDEALRERKAQQPLHPERMICAQTAPESVARYLDVDALR